MKGEYLHPCFSTPAPGIRIFKLNVSNMSMISLEYIWIPSPPICKGWNGQWNKNKNLAFHGHFAHLVSYPPGHSPIFRDRNISTTSRQCTGFEQPYYEEEIGPVIKKNQTKYKSSPDFTGKFYPTCNEDLILIFVKSFSGGEHIQTLWFIEEHKKRKLLTTQYSRRMCAQKYLARGQKQ